jgi:hypothetical protein
MPRCEGCWWNSEKEADDYGIHSYYSRQIDLEGTLYYSKYNILKYK